MPRPLPVPLEFGLLPFPVELLLELATAAAPNIADPRLLELRPGQLKADLAAAAAAAGETTALLPTVHPFEYPGGAYPP